PGTDTVVVDGYTTFVPIMDSGSIEILAIDTNPPPVPMGSTGVPAGDLEFRAGEYDVTIGTAGEVVPFSIQPTMASASTPFTSAAFSMSLETNVEFIQPLGGDPIGALAAINGGAGPDFFAVTLYLEGLTLGCVYDFQTTQPIDIDIAGVQLVEFHFQTLAGAVTSSVITDLTWSSALGDPAPINTVVAPDQSNSLPNLFHGNINLLLGGSPFMEPQVAYQRGDVNNDGLYDISDVIFYLTYLFGSGETLGCEAAGDGNDDKELDVADAIYFLSHLFAGGSAPPAPFDNCGSDTSVDRLSCLSYDNCP
ncbi:MAG: hypothetical protein AAF488_15865, partial [Planctomycetota bacterium]